MTSQIYLLSQMGSPISWNWVTLTGPDAQDFLHRLTTVHVKALAVGRGSPGCFLNAQGKIRAYFTLWHYGESEFAFEFDAGSSGKWKTDLLTLIDQFTFGEKIVLTDVTPQLDSCWIFPEAKDLSIIGAPHLQFGETMAIEEEIRICHHGDPAFGLTWISAWGRPARLSQWLDQNFPEAKKLSFNEIEKWRINALHPRIDTEIVEGSNPLELGLRSAIADDKGCYPGQEVIEKIISLGSPPKRLALIVGEGKAPPPGSTIQNLATPPIEVGQVTSVAPLNPDLKDAKFTALGWIKKIHAQAGLPVQFSDVPATQAKIIQIAPYA